MLATIWGQVQTRWPIVFQSCMCMLYFTCVMHWLTISLQLAIVFFSVAFLGFMSAAGIPAFLEVNIHSPSTLFFVYSCIIISTGMSCLHLRTLQWLVWHWCLCLSQHNCCCTISFCLHFLIFSDCVHTNNISSGSSSLSGITNHQLLGNWTPSWCKGLLLFHIVPLSWSYGRWEPVCCHHCHYSHFCSCASPGIIH